MTALRIRLLGVEVSPITIGELNDLISNSISLQEKRIIANHNLHSIYLYHVDQKMRDFYSVSNCIHIDGMPLVFLGRVLGYPVRLEHRVTYLDWIHPLLDISAQNNWRVFYLGGKPGNAQKAAAKMLQIYPNLHIETHHGYFNKTNHESSTILGKIAKYRANILMVGMGMPLQEHWIMDNLDRIQADVILQAGACFDYIAGVVPSPPRWMGRIGLEWLFRLVKEPGRLWTRYLVEPWFIAGLLLKEMQKKRRDDNA
jgi:N-acetylglucosaminyldiphosphoundecaprenol N-acetyl-beta-D-mannosaminyltransferase